MLVSPAILRNMQTGTKKFNIKLNPAKIYKTQQSNSKVHANHLEMVKPLQKISMNNPDQVSDGLNHKARRNTLKIHQLSKMKSIVQTDDPINLDDSDGSKPQHKS